MEKLEIYEFQALDIQSALSKTAQIYKCRNKITSWDRDIMQTLKMIENVLLKTIDNRVER